MKREATAEEQAFVLGAINAAMTAVYNQLEAVRHITGGKTIDGRYCPPSYADASAEDALRKALRTLSSGAEAYDAITRHR